MCLAGHATWLGLAAVTVTFIPAARTAPPWSHKGRTAQLAPHTCLQGKDLPLLKTSVWAAQGLGFGDGADSIAPSSSRDRHVMGSRGLRAGLSSSFYSTH